MKRTRSEKVQGIIGLIFILMAAVALLAFFNGCATSKTASIQSAPFSYQQGVSGSDQQDFIHLTVHVLFRNVPKKGATARFMGALGQAINDLNVVGAVTSMGTQPERMLSRIEDGTRAHLAIPIKVPVSDQRDTSISVSTDSIQQAAKDALDDAGLDNTVEGVFVDNINVTINSTPIKQQENEPEETQ